MRAIHPAKGNRRCLVWLACLLGGVLLAWLASAQETRHSALVLTVDGSISPAASDYFQRGLRMAEAQDAELLILRLDTPGGLDASMRDMIGAMLASKVPVAVYVAPSGARAASAGTYLLYASHVAAMAPATRLGSATPVQIGGGGGLPGDGEEPNTPAPNDAENGKRRGETAMERKVLEDAVAYIRSLAERHERNADWAESAVRDAMNLNAREALERNVIDVVAADIDDLLQQIDGRQVVMSDGERELDTANLTLERFDPDWRTELLSIIADPNIAYFLMIVGFYGLIFELLSPGALFPGVIGAICLLLALFAFQVLPVNYAGLALVLLGLGLIVGEALMPSFGILGIGGIVAFVTGSVILMDDQYMAVSLPLIGGVALVASGLMLWVAVRFMQLRKRRPHSGQEDMIGAIAVALDDFTSKDVSTRGFSARGHVRLNGERWNATSRESIQKNQRLRVVAIDGLTVEVMPAEPPPPSS
ncbi:NfeD family protein [Halomonas sp. WWR20]